MSKPKKINVAVIGATGYTGLDLILMLSKHPKVNLTNLCATKNLGKKILSLPISEDHTIKEIAYVCKMIKNFFQNID